MLEFVVGSVVLLLVVAGVLVMLGPNVLLMIRRARSMPRPTKVPAVFQNRQQEPGPGLNPKTQRVLVSAARLAGWLRTHGHDDLSRELRAAAARMTSSEAAGLYAMQTALRNVRALETGADERLPVLASELRTAVQDRFEQLELLPFKRP